MQAATLMQLLFLPSAAHSAFRPTQPHTRKRMETSSSLTSVGYRQWPNQQLSHNLRSSS